jgi:lambda family phage portal protein
MEVLSTLQPSTTHISRLDKIALGIAPKWAVNRIVARTIAGNLTAYRSASTGRLRSSWGLTRYGEDAPSSERKIIQQRANDLTRNDPVAAGALDTIRQNVVGIGLRPQSMLRASRLGITEDRAKDIRNQIEHAWQLFTPTADSRNILTFDEIQFLTLSKVIEDGESLVVPTWANEPWRNISRCVEVLSGSRLDVPLSLNSKAKNGIEFGDRGQPLKYYVRKKDIKTGRLLGDYNTIDARDSQGRPKILHLYKTNQPGQTRGIPLFAPALTYFKDLADYLEAEVVAARIAACLAVFITKTDPMGMAGAMASGTDPKTGKRLSSIEPGMIGHLGPNEGIEVVDPKRPGDSLAAFVETMHRIIGLPIGLSYELIGKDFSKTNYSSARASLMESRRYFTHWRQWLSTKLCQPIWNLVIEEAYLKGMIDVSDFYENSHEYLRAQWIGGAWGWVDPVKEIQASKDAVNFNFSTYADETSALGKDWEEVLNQRKRERDYMEEIGLPIPSDNESNGSTENAEQITKEKE